MADTPNCLKTDWDLGRNGAVNHGRLESGKPERGWALCGSQAKR